MESDTLWGSPVHSIRRAVKHFKIRTPSFSGQGELCLKIHDLFNLCQEPTIDLCELENFFDRQTGAERMTDEKHALGIRNAQPLYDQFSRQQVAVGIDLFAQAPGFAVAAQAVAADLKRAQCLLQGFF